MEASFDFVVNIVLADHLIFAADLIAAQCSDHLFLELDVGAENDAEVLGAVHALNRLLQLLPCRLELSLPRVIVAELHPNSSCFFGELSECFFDELRAIETGDFFRVMRD